MNAKIERAVDEIQLLLKTLRLQYERQRRWEGLRQRGWRIRWQIAGGRAVEVPPAPESATPNRTPETKEGKP